MRCAQGSAGGLGPVKGLHVQGRGLVGCARWHELLSAVGWARVCPWGLSLTV